MKKVTIFFGASVLLVGFGLTGCSTTRALEKACENGNWYQQGISDGSRGNSNSVQYETTCRKMGLPINQSLYRQGVSEGLKSYCTYDTGYSMGEAGYRLNQTCSGSLAYNYRRGHTAGVQAKITADRRAAEYEKQETLKRACSYERGYQLGKAGIPPSELCTGSLATDHYNGHRQGLRERTAGT